MLNKSRVFFWILVIFLLPGQVAFTQTLGSYYDHGLQLKAPFTIQQFSNKDGLPQSEVFRILPLRDRSLIFSTGFTPVRFNGYSIKRFLPADESYYFKVWSLPEKNAVYAISNRDGQLQLIYPQFKQFSCSDAPFFTLIASGDSLILLNKKGKLFSFQPATGAFRPIPIAGAALNEKRFFGTFSFCKLNQFLYSANLDGVFRYDLDKKVFSKISDERYKILAVSPYNGKLLGFRQNKIVDILDNEKLYRLLPLEAKDVTVLSICFRSEEELIVGTNRGLCILYNDFEELYDRKTGLPSEYCNSLYYDEVQSTLFVGTGEKGVLKLKFKTNYSYSAAQGCGSIGSVIKRENGEVLFINFGSEIRRLHSDTSVSYISGDAMYASLTEIKGLLLAGTWGDGVMIYDGKKLIDSISRSQLHSENVIACKEMRDGTIYVGSVNGISSGKTFSTIRKREDLDIKGEVLCFAELKDGSICIGTTQNAYLLKNDRIIFSMDNYVGEKGIEFRSFYEDKKGRVWMGTYGKGLFVKDGSKVTKLLERKNCMLDNDAFCLVPDNLGYFYSSSNHGLWRIREKSLFDFYEGKLDYLIPFYYGEEEGILNTEFNGGFQNNFLKKAGGHFYFPGIEGLVMTMPEELKEQKLETKLESVFVNDTLFTGERHVFSRKTYALRFEFSCTNLNQKSNIYFQHKLSGGTSDDWNMPVKSRVVYLSMLPPGSYTFAVRALSGFNDPSPPLLSYAFVIEPFFYETGWFKVFAILLIIAITTTAVLFRGKQLRKKEEESKRFSLEMAELKLNAIQAQLNPHFVFNCLNTIKSLILTKDFEKANQSLNTFSSLTREMLENSDKIFIPFLQNLKFCKDYIQLEKLRLQDEFEYQLTFDSELNDNPLIPHLLIQPYIENAIKHGLAHLEDRQGRLTIEFKKLPELIICRIHDNGIGRTASEKINASRRLHISKGTTLTLEKSTFLKRYMGYDCSITINDVVDEKNKITGTEVLIKMPFVNESWNN